MDIKWTDTLDIAIALDEKHPEIDPLTIRFTDLHSLICDLADFNDDPMKSN